MVLKEKDLITIELPQNGYKVYSQDLFVTQWNKGWKLQILGITDGTEVQFGNDLIENTLNRIVTNGIVEIPDIMLTYQEPIKAYVQVITSNSDTTRYEILIRIEERTKPADYIYPEDEQSFREQMETIMNETKEVAQEALDKATNVEKDAIEGKFNGKDGFSPEITVSEDTSKRYVLNIKTKDSDFLTPNLKGGEAGGGTSNFDDLDNKPQINGNTLQGNKTSEELGLQQKGDYATTKYVDDKDKELEDLLNSYHHVMVGKGAGGNQTIQNIEVTGFDTSRDTGTQMFIISFDEPPISANGLYVLLMINNDEDFTAGYLYDGSSSDFVSYSNLKSDKFYIILYDCENATYHLIGDLNREPLETHYFDGYKFDGTQDINRYAECSTKAYIAEKVITVSDFKILRNKPVTGVSVKVKFTNGNTVENPTLNVNNTSAIPIYYNGANIPFDYLKANMIYEFIYDGSNWVLTGGVESMAPTETNRGGIYATTVEDTANMAEVVIGADGKAYVNMFDIDIGGAY